MRRLDWFLAAVVALFLMSALIIEASAWSIGRLALDATRQRDEVQVSLRRLVSHLPNAPILPGDAR